MLYGVIGAELIDPLLRVRVGGVALIACVVAFLVDANSANQNQTGVPTLLLIALCLLIVPFSAVTCRRLHDRDMSGRLFALEIPLFVVGTIAHQLDLALYGSILRWPFHLVALGCRWGMIGLFGYVLKEASVPGDPGDNRYGPPPADITDNAPLLGEVVAAAGEKARGFAPSSTPAAPAAPDQLVQLERLAKLHRDGALSDEEFARQKAALLGR